MDKCIFCNLSLNKDLIIYKDNFFFCLEDINKVSPIHYLFISLEHFKNLSFINFYNINTMNNFFYSLKKFLNNKKISDFRLVINNGYNSGQSVFHLHIHILSGRIMSWPPG